MEDLQLGYILAGMVNFGVLYYLFKRFLADKLTNLISERRELLKNLEDSEMVVKQKLEDAQKQADVIMQEARVRADELERSADEIAKKSAKDTITAAEFKAQNILEAANRQIEKDEKAMWEKMKEKILGVSIKVNEKLFDNADKNKEFLEKEINSIKI